MSKAMSVRMDRDNYALLQEITKAEGSDLSKAVRDMWRSGVRVPRAYYPFNLVSPISARVLVFLRVPISGFYGQTRLCSAANLGWRRTTWDTAGPSDRNRSAIDRRRVRKSRLTCRHRPPGWPAGSRDERLESCGVPQRPE